MTTPTNDLAQSANANAADLTKKDTSLDANIAVMRQKYESERQARIAAEAKAKQLEESQKRKTAPHDDDDEDDDEPYVDKRKLKKTLARVKEETSEYTDAQVQKAVQQALENERRENWVKQNSDYQEIMNEKNLQDFAQEHPAIAENILRNVPEGFARQQIVYETIKALKAQNKENSKSSVQNAIENNRKSVYYAPSSQGIPPSSFTGFDSSLEAQKAAYNKVQALKQRLGR